MPNRGPARKTTKRPQLLQVKRLTGAGEKAFCAGSDIAELDDYSSPWDFRNRPDYCDAIRQLGKPVISRSTATLWAAGWRWPCPATSAWLRAMPVSALRR